MNRQQRISLSLSAALLSTILVSQGAFAKTAKECTEEWKADKVGMQARGTTEKAYVDQCKTAAEPAAVPAPKPAAAAPEPKPTAAAPASAPTSVSKEKTAKECTEEWKADKVGMQARGTTEKAYVDQCRAGAAPAAAAPEPKPVVAAPTPATVAAPSAPAPAAQKPAPVTMTKPEPPATAPKSATSSTSTATLEAGQFAAESQAKAHCPTDIVVWANLNSKIYHFSG